MRIIKVSTKGFWGSILFTVVFVAIFRGLADSWAFIFSVATTTFLLPTWIESPMLNRWCKTMLTLGLFIAGILMIWLTSPKNRIEKYISFYLLIAVIITIVSILNSVHIARKTSHK